MEVPDRGHAAVAMTAYLSAHLIVSPTQTKSGATENYEDRVHNEAKVAATPIDVAIPESVMAINVAKPPNGICHHDQDGSHHERRVPDGRPTQHVRRAALFSSNEPNSSHDVHWALRASSRRLYDGATNLVQREMASITKLTQERSSR